MSTLDVRLRAARLRAGMTTTALSAGVGLSRQAYAAIEAGRAVPGIDTALRLARALAMPVEDLFGLATASPVAPAVPSFTARVGEREVRVPLGSRHALTPPPEPAAGDVLVLAGCDPGASILARHLLAQHGVQLVCVELGSAASLERLAGGEAHVAGCHLPDTAVRGNAVDADVVHLAVWEQGLVVAPGNPLGLDSVEDLARPGVRLVNRESGSGSRALLDARLAAAGIPARSVTGYGTSARGHLAVADAVAGGLADVGVATAAAARALGLGFVPLQQEAYQLVVPRRWQDVPAVGALLDTLRHPGVRASYEGLGGYDADGMGRAA